MPQKGGSQQSEARGSGAPLSHVSAKTSGLAGRALPESDPAMAADGGGAEAPRGRPSHTSGTQDREASKHVSHLDMSDNPGPEGDESKIGSGKRCKNVETVPGQTPPQKTSQQQERAKKKLFKAEHSDEGDGNSEKQKRSKAQKQAMGQGKRGAEQEISPTSESDQHQPDGVPPGKKQCLNDTPPEFTPIQEENEDWEETDSIEDVSPLDQQQGGKEDADLRVLLQNIPKKNDMDAMMSHKLEGHTKRLEKLVKSEVSLLKSALAEVTGKLNTLETELLKTNKAVEDLGGTTKQISKNVIDLYLRVLDLENRNRRGNIRIRGLPETVSPTDLRKSILSIFNAYLDRP